MFRDGKRKWRVGLTWLAFALLVAASSMLFLFGCGINILSGLQYCPVPIDRSELDRQIATREALQQKIHEAEINVARIAPCAVADAPSPTPTPLPSPTPQRRAADGPIVGKTGRMQITLWWHTEDDIDLYLECNPPGHEMSPSTPASRGPDLCGDGVLDVDANRNMISPTTNPAEHIYWKDNIPPVFYSVKVRPFKTGSDHKIPYSVRIEYDGEEKICSGDVSWNGFTRTGHLQIPIVFTPKHPLAECAVRTEIMNLPCPAGQSCGGNK
jgi:hypothetical protein